jgi:hypothetical protein
MSVADEVLVLSAFVADDIYAGFRKLVDILRYGFSGCGNTRISKVCNDIRCGGWVKFVRVFFQESLDI